MVYTCLYMFIPPIHIIIAIWGMVYYCFTHMRPSQSKSYPVSFLVKNAISQLDHPLRSVPSSSDTPGQKGCKPCAGFARHGRMALRLCPGRGDRHPNISKLSGYVCFNPALRMLFCPTLQRRAESPWALLCSQKSFSFVLSRPQGYMPSRPAPNPKVIRTTPEVHRGVVVTKLETIVGCHEMSTKGLLPPLETPQLSSLSSFPNSKSPKCCQLETFP